MRTIYIFKVRGKGWGWRIGSSTRNGFNSYEDASKDAVAWHKQVWGR